MPGEVVAIVPMKGHSERVPGKNLRLFAGRPLYHWIVTSLLAVEPVAAVVVDTDSPDIADDVAKTFPEVEIRERPSDLLGDEVPMHDIVARIVAERSSGDVFLQTHSTNPLLTPETITRAVDAFFGPGDHDSLMGVTELRTRLYSSDGRPLNHDPEVLLRTQDLDPVLEENSNLYLASRQVISSTGRRVGPNPLLFPIDRHEAVDIDEEIDFVIAECLARWQDGG